MQIFIYNDSTPFKSLVEMFKYFHVVCSKLVVSQVAEEAQ